MKKQAILSLEHDTLSIVGKIQFNSVMSLYKESEKLIASMNHITVDLQKLEHCDSSGLALCTAWMRVAAMQNKPLHFINVPAFMHDLIRVYGLDSVLPIQMVV